MDELEELVVRAQSGDGDAYEAIYARFKDIDQRQLEIPA